MCCNCIKPGGGGEKKEKEEEEEEKGEEEESKLCLPLTDLLLKGSVR